jgi:hypothetical protein
MRPLICVVLFDGGRQVVVNGRKACKYAAYRPLEDSAAR